MHPPCRSHESFDLLEANTSHLDEDPTSCPTSAPNFALVEVGSGGQKEEGEKTASGEVSPAGALCLLF
jgi:hypothetical protein